MAICRLLDYTLEVQVMCRTCHAGFLNRHSEGILGDSPRSIFSLGSGLIICLIRREASDFFPSISFMTAVP